MAKHYFLIKPNDHRRNPSPRPAPKKIERPIPRPKPKAAVLQEVETKKIKLRKSRKYRYKISPAVKRLYEIWFRKYRSDSQFEKKRKLLPAGALQKWYEFRKAAFAAHGGDPVVFDDKLDQIDIAVASDSWHDLDSELSRNNLFVEAMTAREMQQKMAAEKQQEKLVDRQAEEYEEEKKAAQASIGKYPKIPDEGVNAKWLAQVLRIDPHIEPTIFKVKPGQYILAFYKLIEGEETPLYSYQGLPFTRILEILSKQEEQIEVPRTIDVLSVKARWGKKEIEKAFLPEVQNDLKTYFHRYPRDELNVLDLNELRKIAVIKSEAEVHGGLVHWSKDGTHLVKKGRKLSAEESHQRYIDIIQQHDLGLTAVRREIFSTVQKAGLV